MRTFLFSLSFLCVAQGTQTFVIFIWECYHYCPDIAGLPQSGKSQGKTKKKFKVRENSGNFVKGWGKS